MNLYEANKQWASRPADERYWTLEEMLEDARSLREESYEAGARMGQISVSPYGDNADDLRLFGPKGIPVMFTNFSFGQFCARIKAPASYLATLPPALIAEVANWGISRCADDPVVVLGTARRREGRNVLRAMTTDRYQRIWYEEAVRMVLSIAEQWDLRVPPARPAPGIDGLPMRTATDEDVLRSGKFGLPVRAGDVIAPAGLYMSDRDMFVFLVDEARPIELPSGPVYRGVIIKNSEVGVASFSITAFLYDGVCGNHIIWNVQDVREFRIRHVGREAWAKAMWSMETVSRRFFSASSREDLEMIRSAQTRMIGDGRKESVVEKLFEKRLLPRREAEEAYDLSCSYAGVHKCAPGSVWGVVSGVTRLSQETPYADRREALDRAAGKILAAF